MPAPTKPKVGKVQPRVVHPKKTAAQKRGEKAAWKFTQKYQNILATNSMMAEGHGSHPMGPYFYQEGGKMFASLPMEMIQGIKNCPHYEQMKKDCEA